MAKINQTPGTALSAFLKKYNLNYNRLAKAVGLSSAMIRLIARDENPISASVAFRLAKFFKIKPEFWLILQMEHDKAVTAQDKKLAKELKNIPTVDKAVFERKPRTTKAAKSAKKGKTAKGKNAASKKTVKKTVSKKATSKKPTKRVAVKKAKSPAGKRGRPAKKTTVKAAKSPAGKRGRPAAKKTAVKVAKAAKKRAVAKKPAKAPVKKAVAPAKKPVAAAVKPPVPKQEVRPVPPPQPQPQTTALPPELDIDDLLI